MQKDQLHDIYKQYYFIIILKKKHLKMSLHILQKYISNTDIIQTWLPKQSKHTTRFICVDLK